MCSPINRNNPTFEIQHEISESEVISIISSFRASKSKDAYGLDTVFSKTYKDILVCHISHLIDLSIKQGIYPDLWKSAIVTPILKGGDNTNVGNYRTISILPVISKVVEKWVKQLITCLNEGHTPLHPC